MFINNNSPEKYNFLYRCLKRPINAFEIRELSGYWKNLQDKNIYIRLAESQKIIPVLAEIFSQFDIEGWDAKYWKERIELAKCKITKIFAELDRLSAFLSQRDLNWIVLENGAVARGYFYESPHLFSFGDLDLLARPETIEPIKKILLADRYKIISQDEGRIVFSKEIAPNFNIRLNLQTSFVARKWFNLNYNLDLDDIFNNSITLKSSKVRVLPPEYFLLQLCIHSASHSFVRKPGIRLHMDVDWFLRCQLINWEKFDQLVKNHCLNSICYFALFIPKYLFDSPIPEEQFNILLPPNFKIFVLRKIIFPRGTYNLDGAINRWQLILVNLLVVDNLQQFWELLFPKVEIVNRNKFKNIFYILFFYVNRLFRLIFERSDIA